MTNLDKMMSSTSGYRNRSRCSLKNYQQPRGPSLLSITAAVLTMALMLVLQPAPVSATSCQPSDYRHIVGSDKVYYSDLQVAPNSNNDLLIAGSYTEYEFLGNEYVYVYLFQENTCSYRWSFSSIEIQYVQGLAWSADESKAYMFTENTGKLSGEFERLFIFNAPHSKTASVTSYQLPIQHEWGSPLINDGSFFVLHEARSSLQSFLIVRDANVAKFVVGNSFQHCYQTEIQSTSNLHAVFNKDLKSAFILAADQDSTKFHLSKVSVSVLDQYSEGQEATYSVTWPIKSWWRDETLGGRVALYYNQDESSTEETAFIAVSANMELRNTKKDRIELSRMRFDSDALDCSDDGCQQLVINDDWSKVLALSADSATTCLVLAARFNSNVKIYLFDVDFDEPGYTTHTQVTAFQNFIDFSFFPFSAYDDRTLQARPYYSSSGLFEDFYLTTSLKGLPEASDFFFDEVYNEDWDTNEDLSGELGVILSVLDNRVNDFFDDSGTTSKTTKELSPSEIKNEFNIYKYFLTKDQDTILSHFNGQMSTTITYHEDVMQRSRQVKLNNAPYLVPPTEFDVTFNVGQALWTTFPVYLDSEDDTNDEGYFNFVSAEYVNNTTGLPAASDLYSMLPKLNSIRSQTYTAAMAGQHTLNITIADIFNAQASFVLRVTVNATVDTRPVLDQTPLGNQALLGEDSEEAWAEQEARAEEKQEEFQERLESCLDNLRLRRLQPPKKEEEEEDDDDRVQVEGDEKGTGPSPGPNSGPDQPNDEVGGLDIDFGQLQECLFFSWLEEFDIEDEIEYEQEEETIQEEKQEVIFNENFEFDANNYQGISKSQKINKLDILTAIIDRDGILTLTFANDVSFLKDLNFDSDSDSTGRLLRKDIPQKAFDLKDLLDIKFLVDASEDNAESYDFTWKIISIETFKVVIQIIWKDPNIISKDGVKDEISIKINTQIFGDKYKYEQPAVYSLFVPKQNDVNEVEVVEDKSTAQASVAQLGVAGFQLARFLLVGALSQLWGLINGLSLFVHLPLLGVELPAHTLALLNFLIEIAQFDVFENEFVYGNLVPFEEEDDDLLEKYQYFSDTGYESLYAFVNMGTNVIIITILFFFMLLLACLMKFRERQNLVGRFHKKCSGIIFWNFWLRMLIQGCLEIGIGAYLYCIERQKLIDLSPNGYGAFFLINDLLSISFMIILHAMPIFVIIFYCKNFSKMSDKKFSKKWGSTYDGLRTDKKSIICFPVIFLVRRIIFMQLAFFLKNHETGQMYSGIFVIIILMMNLAITIYLMLYKPFASQLLQGLEMFNEITSFVLTYISMCLTGEYVANPEARDNIGYGFNAVMGVNIIVHIYFMIRSSVRDCKKKFTEKKVRAQREAQKKKSEEAQAVKKISNKQRPKIVVELAQIEEEFEEESERSNSQNDDKNNDKTSINLIEIQKSQQVAVNLSELSKMPNLQKLINDRNAQNQASKDKVNHYAKRAQTYAQQEVAHNQSIFETESEQSDRFNIIRSTSHRAIVNDDLIAPKNSLLAVQKPSATKKVVTRNADQDFDLEDAYQDFVVNSKQNSKTDVAKTAKAKDTKLAALSISIKQPQDFESAEGLDEENSEYVLE